MEEWSQANTIQPSVLILIGFNIICFSENTNKNDVVIGQTIMPNRLEIIKNKIQNCKNPTLHLDNLGISDDEVEAIVNEINDRQHIVILHLSNNHISDTGANLLAQHLINACAVVLE
jgi:hypothetical protein